MMQEDAMSLVEHLGELRKRIIWIIAVLVLGMIGGFFVAKPILIYLQEASPLVNATWHAFSPWDGLRVYMQLSFIIALVVTGPVTLYHLWSFVKPGLSKEEQKATIGYIPFSVLLFLVGLAFAYFVVFPMAFKFASGLTGSLMLTETYGITQYFSFMFNILLPISLLFELPVVVMFLTRIRLLNPIRLHKMRRYAYLALVILSTVVTPPDALSAIIVAIPLIILYEISVLLSKVIYRKQLAKDRVWADEYGDK
ncbi:twin-arginine translocase subunit TatC [Paenibacillus psychroresistens]|nr:twin-arginine translocase subunit TatC [Paenibacillus psychroresistens]